MKNSAAVLFVGMTCFYTHGIYPQTSADVCKAMVTDAAHNVNVNTADNSYYVTLYNNFCYADGSTNQAAVNSEGSAVVDAIPITGSLAANDNMSRFTNFCSNYKSVAAGASNSLVYQSAVVGKSLDAANQCMAIVTGHGMSLTYQASTPPTLLINLSIPGGQTMVVQGISSDPTVTCVGPDLQNPGKTIDYGTGVGQTITGGAGSTTITCTRTPFSTLGGQTMYAAASVAVSTSVGPLNVYWPQDSSLPLLTASQIQASLSGITAQVNQLQSSIAYDALPIGTIIPWFQRNANPPAGWTKCDGSDTGHCPNLSGMFLRGSDSSGVGSTGGSASSPVGQFGSNSSHGDGNGWSKDGNHYLSNDNVTVTVMPPYASVLYIMKVANQ